MSYVNMGQILKKAREERYAVGAFNILNHLTAKAVIDAAEELRSPLILQTSTATVKFHGVDGLIKQLIPMAEYASIPVAVHLDHCTDADLAKKCLDAGWSSVMFDGSKKPLDENIRLTKEIAAYAKKYNATVEGELGAIVGVEEDVIVASGDEALAKVDECKIFLEQTGIDAFAPAIGTAHGLYKGKPKINFDLFKEIEEISSCPLVVHGGTGLEGDVFKQLISLGAAKVNISTAIKIAYCSGLKSYIENNADKVEPLKLDQHVIDVVKNTTKEHILLFGSANRI
ncbi:class II fructose-bisphosphate aldolase [Petroclostridium sp. X23]|uniref:class II fructose-bisphosphate aldolase n=1 Tax=Petroclostridium sp. X23 TaxID=3045146 RepID=UPI0024AE6A6A|nr:class II fructose-bisphosphate aldolase [Petroclostridium sp. X23]WHH59919.1 class II fructose-bisphosphate aldolase [Petroclostridium sp. X23]